MFIPRTFPLFMTPSTSHWRDRGDRAIVRPALGKEAHEMKVRLDIANHGEVRLVSESY
jgi:hypothetical protein